jgi:hypothetical protein
MNSYGKRTVKELNQPRDASCGRVLGWNLGIVLGNLDFTRRHQTRSSTIGLSGAVGGTFSQFQRGVVTTYALEVGAAGDSDNREDTFFRISGSMLFEP